MTAPGPTVPVGAGARLRRGVSTKGPDNVLASLVAGDYAALAQCAGEEVVISTGARNYWWVKIDANGTTGWVSAVEILEGGGDAPIADVPQVPTVND
jgi:hypothetical protein